jgi:hypothetical protein
MTDQVLHTQTRNRHAQAPDLHTQTRNLHFEIHMKLTAFLFTVGEHLLAHSRLRDPRYGIIYRGLKKFALRSFFAAPHVFFSLFYLPIAKLPIILDHSLKPLDPIEKHRNDHVSVDFAEYLAHHSF